MAEETAPDNTDAALKALAAQADNEGWEGDSVVEQSEATTEQAESEPQKEVTQESGTEVTKETPQKEDGLSEPETQAEIDYKAEYEKLRKEEERKERSWKRLNEEKEALAKLKAVTRADETRIAGDQFSAEEYEQYAERLVEQGEPAQAKMAMTKAKEIRQKAFIDRYNETVKEAIDEDPELADQQSELAKSVQSLLKDPSFGGVPGGFKNAVRLAKAEKAVASVPGLKGEIDNYKKEIQRLNKAMEVGGSSKMPKRESAKSFNDMNMDEMRAHIRQRAEEADAANYD